MTGAAGLARRHPWLVAGLLGGLRLPPLVTVAALFSMATARGAPGDVPGIPEVALDAYLAASASERERSGCRVGWTVLAAIGKIESDHGRTGGAHADESGDVSPAIVGPRLDGRAGLAKILDTDRGRLDGDAVFDRAVGPMQFLPQTWGRWGRDGNGNSRRDVHNLYDAALGAAVYLCAGMPRRRLAGADLERALYAYNHSRAYVGEVLSVIDEYEAYLTEVVPSNIGAGDYVLPVAQHLVPPEGLSRPHHDYPAWDLALPIGTPITAVASGVVSGVTYEGACGLGVFISDAEGFTYGYCHGSAVFVGRGDAVEAGKRIMLSGNSGNSSGPHLHLQIEDAAGALRCPQPLLERWYAGDPARPADTPLWGCTS